ncbi:MAG: asparagine synthetase B family protein [Bacteroidia bacterium]|nr:asparagine synthetase B family protein [Bacteroidia bacterium]
MEYILSHSWIRGQKCFVRGYCFDEQSNFIKSDELLSLFSDIQTEKEFSKKLKQLNGIFQVIVETSEGVLAAGDIAGTNPLYYRNYNNKCFLSDDAYSLLKTDEKIYKDAATDYTNLNYTLHSNTLINGIHRIEPMTYARISDNRVIASSYYSYRIYKNEINNIDIQYRFSVALLNVFGRLIKYINGRQVIVPLSGGYDSRLIVAMLYRLNCKNIICYTIGDENSEEFEIAKTVAKRLGFKHYCIDNKLMATKCDLSKDAEFLEYCKYVGQLSNKIWTFDFLPVRWLKEQGIAESDAIFIPGHSGDCLAGSHSSKNHITQHSTRSYMALKIMEDESFLGRNKALQNKIIKLLQKKEKTLTTSNFDNFVIKNRLAKYINTATRVYSYFGFDIALPFWDIELMNFFKTLHPSLKKNQKFYHNYLDSSLFEPLDISFKGILQASDMDLKLHYIKSIIKRILPLKIALSLSHTPDLVGMDAILKPFVKELAEAGIKTQTNNPNEIMALWYLYQVKQNLCAH